jgi:uncharacterized protein (TIGR03790 family)
MRHWIALFIAFFTFTAFAENDGRDVVVVFNSNMAESKDVAEHYAKMRDVPSSQVIGFNLPRTEAISRAQYRESLQDPLLNFLEKQKLFTFKDSKVTSAQFRYIVLCFGVPLKIENDPSVKEKVDPSVKNELRNNGAAVDSELAALPLTHLKYQLTGPLRNAADRTTNSATLNPTNGLIMVARLDGPSAEIARSLVDKAVQAERDGLWGRAYFDMRGLTNGPFAPGETNLMTAAETALRSGFDTLIDRRMEPFSKAFPMSQIALYAGWGEGNVTGPFTRKNVEFMPGAFAFAIESFSAATLRSSQHWTGAFLSHGATATMGAVDEPYLAGLPDMGVFFTRWLLLGKTYGEAAYSSMQTISWQDTVIGDPLYRPFRKDPQQLHQELAKRGSKLLEWSHLKVININVAMRTPFPELIKYLQDEPLTKTSAVLSEKLGDFYAAQNKVIEAADQYRQALKNNPSPQQEVRLRLNLINMLLSAHKKEEAKAELKEFHVRCPDYPDADVLDQQMQNALQSIK